MKRFFVFIVFLLALGNVCFGFQSDPSDPLKVAGEAIVDAEVERQILFDRIVELEVGPSENDPSRIWQMFTAGYSGSQKLPAWVSEKYWTPEKRWLPLVEDYIKPVAERMGVDIPVHLHRAAGVYPPEICPVGTFDTWRTLFEMLEFSRIHAPGLSDYSALADYADAAGVNLYAHIGFPRTDPIPGFSAWENNPWELRPDHAELPLMSKWYAEFVYYGFDGLCHDVSQRLPADSQIWKINWPYLERTGIEPFIEAVPRRSQPHLLGYSVMADVQRWDYCAEHPEEFFTYEEITDAGGRAVYWIFYTQDQQERWDETVRLLKEGKTVAVNLSRLMEAGYPIEELVTLAGLGVPNSPNDPTDPIDVDGTEEGVQDTEEVATIRPILVYDSFPKIYTDLTGLTLMPEVAKWAAKNGVKTCAMYHAGGLEINEPKLRDWLARIPDYIEWGCIDHEMRDGPINAWMNQGRTVEEHTAALAMVRDYMRIVKEVRPDIKWGVWGLPLTKQWRNTEVLKLLDWYSPPLYDTHLSTGPTGSWSPLHQQVIVGREVGMSYGVATVTDKLVIPCIRMRIGPSSSPHRELMELITIEELFNETVTPIMRITRDGLAVWGKVRRTYAQGTLQMYCPEEWPWGVDYDADMDHLEYEQARRFQYFILVSGGGWVNHPFKKPIRPIVDPTNER